jgi:hypothetical protein
MGIRGDLVLIQTAVNRRWLTDELKERVIETLSNALESGDTRAKLRAAQIIVAMESQNQKDEHKELANLHERISAIANRFGVSMSSGGDIEATEVATIGSHAADTTVAD